MPTLDRPSPEGKNADAGDARLAAATAQCRRKYIVRYLRASAVTTSDLEPNPYASPTSPAEERQPDWYLLSACRYFKGIGWVAIIYLLCVTPFALYESLTEKSPLVGELVGMPTMAAAAILFFGVTIRTAMLLPRDFERLYKRARWLGILAGSFGFPVLTIPALIAVSRLAKYRAMVHRD